MLPASTDDNIVTEFAFCDAKRNPVKNSIELDSLFKVLTRTEALQIVGKTVTMAHAAISLADVSLCFFNRDNIYSEMTENQFTVK